MKVIDVLQSPWAIVPDRLIELTNIYSTHLRGEKIDIDGLEARLGEPLANNEQGYYARDGVAVIPVEGIISKKMNLFSQVSGGVSTQLVERDFGAALHDSMVHSIILHLDTPGGSVDGISQLAATIFDARGSKPIYALADGLMASAGVWLGTAADKVFIADDTTQVGSIGVVTTHTDFSAADKKRGIKVTEIYAGKYKRIASAHESLSEEGEQYIQDRVDYIYSIFVDAVAKYRSVAIDNVLENMADGKLFIGTQAIDAGLVDGFATLDQLVAELAETNNLIETLTGGATYESRAAAQPPSVVEQLPENLAQAYEAGVAAGAAQERNRIQAVRSWRGSFGGTHDGLIERLMFDGTTTREQAASEIIAIEKEHRAVCARARAADAATVNEITASVELDKQRVAAAESAEARIRINWEANAGLRRDFGNDFDRYAAYAKNQRLTLVEGSRD